jgi:hypothetical protein
MKKQRGHTVKHLSAFGGWGFLLSGPSAESKKKLNLSVLCVSAVNFKIGFTVRPKGRRVKRFFSFNSYKG